MRQSAFLGISSVIFALVAGGCSNLGYLIQAGRGQWELSNRAQPIPVVLSDARLSPRIRELLTEIPEVKGFGEGQGLKATKNYSDYAKLNRSAAVWVVSACEELKFAPKTWNFPIVGSFTYLGWFDEKDARDFAKQLKAQGLDVDVRPARAYSTLGWFRDPVLSTMISDGTEARGQLVNTILHESVHATIYLNGQSYFNESLASFIADRMTPQYLRSSNAADLASYVELETDSEKRAELFHTAYGQLEKMYQSQLSMDEKREQKKAIMSELRNRLGIKREITNATIIQFRTYGLGKAEFAALYRACGEDWKRFIGVLSSVKASAFGRAQQEDFASVLQPLVANGCRPSKTETGRAL